MFGAWHDMSPSQRPENFYPNYDLFSPLRDRQSTPISINSFVSTILMGQNLRSSGLKCIKNMLDPVSF
jgi:hypothetical protein